MYHAKVNHQVCQVIFTVAMTVALIAITMTAITEAMIISIMTLIMHMIVHLHAISVQIVKRKAKLLVPQKTKMLAIAENMALVTFSANKYNNFSDKLIDG